MITFMPVLDTVFRRMAVSFPASWRFTHYLPSAILISFGLWVLWDGIRYETIFGRIILPGLGAAITALGWFLFCAQRKRVYSRAVLALSKIFVFLFVYV